MFLMSIAVFSQTPPIEPGVSHELAKWRAARYSDVRYSLNLTLEKMSPVLKGTMEIRVRVNGGEGEKRSGGAHAETRPVASVPPIIFDWRKIKGFEKSSDISNVSINGKLAVSVWCKLTIIVGPSGGTTKRSPLCEPDSDEALSYSEDDDHIIFDDGVVLGENVIKLDFTSPILTSGSAITRYVDKEDGAEYIYSLFVPSDASTAFPVFDQPDLKARFTVNVSAPKDWRVISNGEELQTSISSGPDWKLPLHRPTDDLSIDVSKPTVPPKVSNTPTVAAQLYSRYFNETKPISTYVFAFAAGPFTEFDSNQTKNPDRVEAGLPAANKKADSGRASPLLNGGDVFSSKIYVRKSQAEKFKPHAAEVFRLNREGVKFLEGYFDYKFPFP